MAQSEIKECQNPVKSRTAVSRFYEDPVIRHWANFTGLFVTKGQAVNI